MDIILLLLYILSLLLIWQFVGYTLAMGLIAFLTKPNEKDYSYNPFISVIVPTYNERTVIDNRINNLLVLEYSKDNYEIIIVDSGSNDGTVSVIENIIKRNIDNPKITLLEEGERKGKASAINFGKKVAKGEIVLVTDANSIFDKNVLKEIAPHFKDPKVGAVGGRYIVLNPKNSIENSTQFYWDIEYIMRIGESALDSACLFHGEINAWRKSLVEADTKALSEDLDMAIKIRKQEKKIVYEPNAIVYEPAASNVSEQKKQRKRTSIGTIQNIFKHWKYLILPKDLYRALIFPSHKIIVMFSPFIIFLIIILYILSNNIMIVFEHIIISSLIFIIAFIMLMYIRRIIIGKSVDSIDNKNKSKLTLKSIISIMFYVLFNEYLILLAWKDFLFGRYSILWEKTESNR